MLALGALVLTLERTFRPEVLYPWLGLTSGVAALVLGCYLLWTRIRAARGDAGRRPRPRSRVRMRTTTRHVLGRPLPSPPLAPDGGARGCLGEGLVALALAGGILPAPSALIVMLGAESTRIAWSSASTLVACLQRRTRRGVDRDRTSAPCAHARRWRRGSRASEGRMVPVLVGHGAIVAVGVFLAVRGVTQI